MMADFLYKELYKVGMAALLGISLGLAYDVLRLIRILFKHNTVALSTEDIIFCFCIIFPVFSFIVKINNGIFRLYLVLGVLLGFFIYRESVGRFIIWFIGGILGKIRKTVIKVLKKHKDTDKIKNNNANLRRRRWHNEKKIKS